jgi:translation initiation factor IF-2
LLDALRSTDVVSKESGGITQHIGAYMIKLSNTEAITFLDTPGHEAFTAMRMRGAKVTDIVVLVVAADDSIKEQTIEAINHAKAAGVAIIVAINKIDKPDANPAAVKQALLSHNLVPEDMGGDVMVVEVSARDKLGLDKLEEVILLQAELLSLKANYGRVAKGTVIESKVDKGRGIVATFLVQNGTLRVGDIVVAGSCYGKIRSLMNDKKEAVAQALPSTPVEVLGLSQVPLAGDEFLVVADERTAKELADFRAHRDKEKRQLASRRFSLEQLFTKAQQEGSHKELPVIIKADVHGSAEAITASLLKIPSDEISLKILHSGVGGVTESDITLAAASGALVIGFNVRANNPAKDLAKNLNVEIKYYSIIYNLVDEVRAVLTGMLSPKLREKFLGSVDVRQVFDLTKFGKVAGCYVTEGIVQRAAHVRLLRDDVVIHTGKLKALKRFKEDLKEVKSGFECGISLERYEDIKVGDKLEIFEIIEEARSL